MKRKIGLFFLMLSLVAVSCKKEYTCDCTATAVDNSNGEIVRVSNTSKAYDKKLSKKQAQAACDHETFAIQSSAESFFQNPLVTPYYDVSISTACTLK